MKDSDLEFKLMKEVTANFGGKQVMRARKYDFLLKGEVQYRATAFYMAAQLIKRAKNAKPKVYAIINEACH